MTVPAELQPAVSQLQIAEELIRQHVTAAMTLQFAPNPAEVVEQVNLIYPGIWENLVGARDILARLGRPVEEFDRLRAQEHGNEVLAGGVEHHLAVDLPKSLLSHGLVLRTATCSIDMRGVACANRCLGTLRELTPEVDWSAARASDAVPDLASGNRNLAAMKWILIGALVLLILYLLSKAA
jgi:hypothetical protein